MPGFWSPCSKILVFKAKIVKVRPGPVVTLYEFEPAPGIKSSRVIGLADDIARSMSAISARVAVVQGRNAMGIELPNSNREIVSLRELLESETSGTESVKVITRTRQGYRRRTYHCRPRAHAASPDRGDDRVG